MDMVAGLQASTRIIFIRITQIIITIIIVIIILIIRKIFYKTKINRIKIKI